MNSVKTLAQVKVGQKATVDRILGEGALKRHILDMGITKGAVIEVHKAAPFGDPIQITVRGFELTLRKEDAKMISITNVTAITKPGKRGA
jgi:ferrous iron transport protein A